ncbi:hypothetical protein [Thiomonas sp. FB-Cd]|uniref:hypothetical protein n=1 Tax=Thiomonas sp. FB-Cd TaxID=1158292 RepID=UPI00068E5DD9|nr:hypothetical protein [Thiomonas sp. FB-Cd]
MNDKPHQRPTRITPHHVSQLRDTLAKILPTPEAAQALGRQPQTLRRWACEGSGPITPIRINGRLHWAVADLQKLLNGEV